MSENQSRYELHFHGLVQDAVTVEPSQAQQIYQNSLTQPTSSYQLPLQLADFTGRQGELERLTGVLKQAISSPELQAAIALITGVAGVGKSALAVQVAHQLQSEFPDAQLYVNLRGSEGQPLDPLDVLAGLLRVWGVEDQSIPQSLSERSQLYHSVMAGKRVLLILDNARDEFQIRPLLPECSTCAVLITTRRQINGLEEATIVELPVMSEPEARSLLENIIGAEVIAAEPDATQHIITQCDYLPLALRITGGFLRQSPHWKLADYASKLEHERQRLAQMHLSDLSVRPSLVLSYQSLDEASARLFRLLGLLVGVNFKAEVAPRLLEVEPAIAQQAFDTLVAWQLVTPVSQGRYHFHDVVRLFARGQLAQQEPADVRQAARLRLSRWYLETAKVVDLAINPETRRSFVQSVVKGKDQAPTERRWLLTALYWFEIERPNILASVEWAHQAEAWDVVVSLAQNLVNFFNTHGYWGDWERTHGLALEASRELGDRDKEAQTLINLGNVYSLEGQWEKANQCYQQSLGIFNELSDRPGMAKTLSNLGNVYFQQQQNQNAIDCYQQSLSMFQELRDRYREGQTLANMGIFSAQNNQPEQAIQLWQDSLTKLHPNLPKFQRVAEWLQSIKGQSLETSSPTQTPQPQRLILYWGGVFILVMSLILSIIMLTG
ncbi:MAG: tetratricopeptide repeat protein [Coleofasciculus chthonoplastes F3-SA18-01]|uniref:tetratricopeptide repeat protein n=1 Tax=Coleofasciculus chthonoplastes TaxID=64178 RepID=UPI0032F46D19